jgi:hypothetical protein
MKRPPFSRLFDERAADPTNRQCGHWVLIGSAAWEVAADWRDNPSWQRRAFTLCPPGEDPAAYDWSIYRRSPLPVALLRCGDVDGSQLQQLARAVLASGVQRIYDLAGDVSYQAASGVK